MLSDEGCLLLLGERPPEGTDLLQGLRGSEALLPQPGGGLHTVVEVGGDGLAGLQSFGLVLGGLLVGLGPISQSEVPLALQLLELGFVSK